MDSYEPSADTVSKSAVVDSWCVMPDYEDIENDVKMGYDLIADDVGEIGDLLDCLVESKAGMLQKEWGPQSAALMRRRIQDTAEEEEDDMGFGLTFDDEDMCSCAPETEIPVHVSSAKQERNVNKEEADFLYSKLGADINEKCYEFSFKGRLYCL
ncbi:uncharacterized protein [Littorina saxatilis]|uniref:uncharacterized protein n=1 Tax=Littorina saxatilis TaxID=31220 RepID=UPI0038B5BD5E